MDIKASKRNGPVVGIVPVTDEDELLMITSLGKIQRVAAAEIGIIGRNTQGVRIMNVDDGDTLKAIVKVPKDEVDDEEAIAANPADPAPTDEAASEAGDASPSDAASEDASSVDGSGGPDSSGPDSSGPDSSGPDSSES
jgi:DNA gyrase subunit A